MNPLVLSIIALVLYLSIKDVNIRSLPLNIVMPAILLVLFAPGLLLEIPPQGHGILMSGHSSVPASVVHAGVVGGVFYLLLKNFPQYY